MFAYSIPVAILIPRSFASENKTMLEPYKNQKFLFELWAYKLKYFRDLFFFAIIAKISIISSDWSFRTFFCRLTCHMERLKDSYLL